jgi:branched-chain amino acid transport system substrate-binding protein
MKKIWIPIIVVIIIIVAVVVFYKPTPKEPIKIGAILQLSGAGALYGEYAKRGIDLAVEEINSGNGVNGRKIKIIYEDSQNEPTLAISAFRKLKDVDKVKFIISEGSRVALALISLSNQEKIIQMEIGSITQKYRVENDFTFRTAITALQLATHEAGTVISRNIKKVALLYVGDDYGYGMMDVFKKAYNDLGGEIIAEETFLQTDKDFRTQLFKIKTANPSALIICTRLEQTGLILKQIKEIGLISQIFTDVNTIESQQVINTARGTAEGVIYVASKFDPNENDVSKKYFQKFQEEYKISPEEIGAQSYDGLFAIVLAIKECPDLDTSCVKNNLNKIEFDGVFGKIKFDSAGDVVDRSVILKTIKNGEFVPYEE